ncbi:MAG: M13 family metallopeptidase [Aeromonas sp.]
MLEFVMPARVSRFACMRSVIACAITSSLLLACASPEADSALTVAAPSGILRQHMDLTTPPGEDFFRYVNGHWLERSAIPDDRATHGAFHELRDKSLSDVKALVEALPSDAAAGSSAQQISDLYRSVLNSAARERQGVSALSAELAAIKAIDSKPALMRAFARANQVGGNAPFGFWIGADAKAPDTYAVYLYQSGLGLPDRDYYLKQDPEARALRADYQAHIKAMLTNSGQPAAQSAAQAKRILALESALAAIHWDKVALRDRDKTYNKQTQTELNTLAPALAWDSYLTAAGLAGQPTLIVGQPSYLGALNQLLQTTPLADWRAYLTWQLLSDFAPYLDSATDAQHFAFYGTRLSGTPKQRAPWQRAVGVLNAQLGEPVGQLYVARYFPPVAKARMEALVENLRAAYSQSIDELDWMSAATKVAAKEKLAKFRPKIGYPSQWKSYAGVRIAPNDLAGNLLRLRAHDAAEQLARLGTPVDKNEWHMPPQTVNAYYNPSNNEIVFPAAILQPPFFDLTADDAVNYGAIGGVIGHEMGHGFDDQGAKSDGDGRLRNWWSAADLTEFKARTEQLIAQYNRFSPLPEQFVNGQFTLGENIGDLGGLAIAHRAYQLSLGGQPAPTLDGFSGEQRFFIGWAQVWRGKSRPEQLQIQLRSDPHSPAQYRVNGVLPNLEAFYHAFNVTPDQALYLPAKARVKIW